MTNRRRQTAGRPCTDVLRPLPGARTRRERRVPLPSCALPSFSPSAVKPSATSAASSLIVTRQRAVFECLSYLTWRRNDSNSRRKVGSGASDRSVRRKTGSAREHLWAVESVFPTGVGEPADRAVGALQRSVTLYVDALEGREVEAGWYEEARRLVADAKRLLLAFRQAARVEIERVREGEKAGLRPQEG
jgi:hypothetical protein